VRTLGWPATVGALLLVTALVVYLPALDGDLLWDDAAHVTGPVLQSVAGLWRIWTDSRAALEYYPLTDSAFWVQRQLWGLAPLGYHVVNVLLHAASAVLLWRILAGLAVPGALVAAAVWAVHPVQVETVARIAELKSTLSTVFFFAALLAYLRFDPPGIRGGVAPADAGGDDRDWRLYAVALACFVAALLSKTATVALLVVLPLICWWKEGRLDRARRWLPLLPFFTVGAALALPPTWPEPDVPGAEAARTVLGWTNFLLVVGRAPWFYVGKLVWPTDLVFVYPRWTVDPSAWPHYVYPAAAIAVPVALWALRGRLGRGPLVAVLCFGAILVADLTSLESHQVNDSFVADRFQYLASAALIALVAGLAGALVGRLGAWSWRTGAGAGAVVVALLAVVAWRQAHVYASVEALVQQIAARNPAGIVTYLNLGGVYFQHRRFDDAIRIYRGLIAVQPEYARAYADLGLVYTLRGRHDEAAALCQRALALDPGLADAHHYLGHIRDAQGRREEAIAEYRAALAVKPDLLAAALSLGNVYVAVGRHAEAIATLQALVARSPRRPEAHYALGAAFAAIGEKAQAIDAYRTAIALRPSYPEAYNNLGIEYRRNGQLAEAVAAYRSAIAIDPGFAMAYNNLGAAYAEHARYAEAADAWQQALRVDPLGATGRMARQNLEVVRLRWVH
jgi:tetratricopeptide (TPR) repeat protein